MSQLHKMQVTDKPLPHLGKLLIQVMKQKMITKTELSNKMGVSPSNINQYTKQSTMHAAQLWKLGEVLEYNFFAVLSAAFPLQTSTPQEEELLQHVNDLKKENELYKNLIIGKLGS